MGVEITYYHVYSVTEGHNIRLAMDFFYDDCVSKVAFDAGLHKVDGETYKVLYQEADSGAMFLAMNGQLFVRRRV